MPKLPSNYPPSIPLGPLSEALGLVNLINNNSYHQKFATPVECEEFFANIFTHYSKPPFGLSAQSIDDGPYKNLNFIWFTLLKAAPMYEIVSHSISKARATSSSLMLSNLCQEIVIPLPCDSERLEVLRCLIRAGVKHVATQSCPFLQSRSEDFYENLFPQLLVENLQELTLQSIKINTLCSQGKMFITPMAIMRPSMPLCKLCCLVDVLIEQGIKINNTEKLNISFLNKENMADALPSFKDYVQRHCQEVDLDSIEKSLLLQFLHDLFYSVKFASSFQTFERYILEHTVPPTNAAAHIVGKIKI